jgi:MYXO-CTERM domain-containing protein
MRRESRRGWSTVGVTGIVITATILGAAARRAEAYCRTTTSKVPPDYDPAECGCWTYGLPLYWSNACVSYDIQQDASSEVPYAAAASAIATAFSKWTSTTCSADAGTGRVSIDVRDFGPVACGKVEYDQYGPNQHVILFDKNLSDFTDSSNALALTTVTYNIDTGEIFDADMQINATVPLSTSATPPTGSSSVYDFASIVTHETGHFLGMAHAVDARATMYAFIDPGEDSERLLTVDDRNGICTIYPPDGTRTVAAVDGGPEDAGAPTASCSQSAAPPPVPTRSIPAVLCDPTPRHGFTTQCDGADGGATGGGCSIASASDHPATGRFVLALTGLLMLVGVIARAHRRRAGYAR